jgi:hypothetical protein
VSAFRRTRGSIIGYSSLGADEHSGIICASFACNFCRFFGHSFKRFLRLDFDDGRPDDDEVCVEVTMMIRSMEISRVLFRFRKGQSGAAIVILLVIAQSRGCVSLHEIRL